MDSYIEELCNYCMYKDTLLLVFFLSVYRPEEILYFLPVCSLFTFLFLVSATARVPSVLVKQQGLRSRPQRSGR